MGYTGGMAPAPEIVIEWPVEANEQGWDMLWFGSWLVGADGGEGGWFYSGRGGESGSYRVPSGATGLRIRRWPNEGLEPEYVDVLSLTAVRQLTPGALEFDRRQRFSRLQPDFA